MEQNYSHPLTRPINLLARPFPTSVLIRIATGTMLAFAIASLLWATFPSTALSMHPTPVPSTRHLQPLGSASPQSPASGFDDTVQVLMANSQGQVLIGGNFTRYNTETVPTALMRLNKNGSRDSRFNVNGTGFKTSLGTAGTVYALAQQANGFTLVGGIFHTYNDKEVSNNLVRLDRNGNIDPTFNPSGFHPTGLGWGPNGSVNALLIQPDGKILIGGQFSVYNGGMLSGSVLRLNADGSPDGSFNTFKAGIPSPGIVRVLALQADGKILVGGKFDSYNETTVTQGLVRINYDGSRDGTFNAHEKANEKRAKVSVYALAVQPDGNILVGGEFYQYNGGDNVPHNLLRLTTKGEIDTTFNYNSGARVGFATKVNQGRCQVLALGLQPDGKVVVGGRFTLYNSIYASPAHVLLLNPNGTLAASYNGSSKGANAAVHAVLLIVGQGAVVGEGKVLIGGEFTAYDNNQSVPSRLLRLTADNHYDCAGNSQCQLLGATPTDYPTRSFTVNVYNGFQEPIQYTIDEIACYEGDRMTSDMIEPGCGQSFQVLRRQGKGCDGKNGEFFIKILSPEWAKGRAIRVSFTNNLGFSIQGRDLQLTYGLNSMQNDGKGNFYDLTLEAKQFSKFTEKDLKDNIAVDFTADSLPFKKFANGPYTREITFEEETGQLSGNYYEACFGVELWHPQHIVRLPNKRDASNKMRAYFMISQSKAKQGYIYVVETYPFMLDSITDLISSNKGTVGKVVWEQYFDNPNWGDWPSLISRNMLEINPNVIGNWNHPCKMDASGGLLVVAAQNWHSKYCVQEEGRSEEALLFYDVRNPLQPRYLGKITTSQFSLTGNMSCVALMTTANGDRLLNVGGNGSYKLLKAKDPKKIGFTINDWQYISDDALTGQHGKNFAIKGNEKTPQQMIMFNAVDMRAFDFNKYTYDAATSKFSRSGGRSYETKLPGAKRDWDSEGLYVSKQGFPIIYAVKSLEGKDVRIYQSIIGNETGIITRP